jgi:serine/threonine protein kinase
VAGFVIGTFQSLSPEQTRGEAATTASDIWAFGVLMYEMLTASLPFEGSNAAELFSKIGRAQFTPPTVLKPGVPKALEQIVGRCLRRNPEDRYHSMRELREDLERAAHGPRTMPEFIPASGRPLWQMALAVLAVLILLVIGYVVLRPGPKRPDTGTDANGVDVVQPGSQSGGTSNGATSGSLAPGPSGGDDMTAAGLTEEKLRTVRIDTFEGSAEVWQNGVKVGDTPFDFHEKYGTTVTGILKRPGFQDKSFQFEVGDRRSYEFALDRIGEQ